VRYFGGVKLGAGGLVRAYTDCIAQALLTADKIERVAQAELDCSLPYAQEGLVRRLLDEAGATLLEVSHGALVRTRSASRPRRPRRCASASARPRPAAPAGTSGRALRLALRASSIASP
jgi:hypothetical protein